jgi:uncharacterized protein YjiS (DUF1127 family)
MYTETVQRHRTSTLGVLQALWRSTRDGYARLGQRRRDRAAFRRLLELDDHLLADIGCTREEVRWAASLPSDTNAALALRARVLARRRRGVPG